MTKSSVIIPTNGVDYHSAEPRDQFSRTKSNFSRSLKRHRIGRKKLFGVVAPLGRLVGIELNPGPNPTVGRKANKPRKSAIAKRPRRPATASSSSTRTISRLPGVGLANWKSSLPKRFQHNPSLSDYVKSLTNPFFHTPPKLGFNTFVPSAKMTGWYENTALAIGAGSTCFAISYRPSIGTDAISYFGSAFASTTLATSTVNLNNSLSNAVNLATRMQTGRNLSAELRVRVRCAGTSLPGSLGGIYIPDDTLTNLAAFNYTQLTALSKYVPASSATSGIGCSVQFRPIDATSFEFSTIIGQNVSVPGNVTVPDLVVIGTGWPAGAFAVEVSIVNHFEALCGLDVAGEADYEPPLSESGTTMDHVANQVLQMGPPVVTSLDFLDMLDNGLSHANAMRSGRGPFGNGFAAVGA